MDGLDNPKIFYEYWFKLLIYYSYTHNSSKMKGRRQRDVNTATAVFAITFSTENFLATGYYSPWGLHPLCQVVWGKKKVIELDETTVLLCQGPWSDPGMKTSMELTHTGTCMGLDSSLTLSSAS